MISLMGILVVLLLQFDFVVKALQLKTPLLSWQVCIWLRLKETKVGYQTQECPINTCLFEEILLKLSRTECFLLIKHTSLLYEMNCGIHFTDETWSHPFLKLLQLATCCTPQLCKDMVHHHANNFLGLPIHSYQWSHHLIHLESTS